MRAFYKLRYYTMLNNQVVIPQGATSKVVVVSSIPPTGLVHKVAAKQTGGANIAFNVDLLDFNPSAGTTPPPDLGMIIDTIAVTSGNTGKFSSDHGVPFVLPDRQLYIRVWVASAAASDLSFDLSIVLATND